MLVQLYKHRGRQGPRAYKIAILIYLESARPVRNLVSKKGQIASSGPLVKVVFWPPHAFAYMRIHTHTHRNEGQGKASLAKLQLDAGMGVVGFI